MSDPSDHLPGPVLRRAGLWPRVLVYGGLALALIPLTRWLLPRQVRADLAALIEQVERSPECGQHHYREGLTSIHFLPGEGYTLSMFVGDDPGFAPGRIAVLLRTRQRLQLELLIGFHHTQVLLDAQAEAFLARAGVSLQRLDALFQARWAQARAGPRLVVLPVGKVALPVGK